MFNSIVLDVAIGLIFVYLLLGLICTTVNEWIAQKFKLRAATLKQGIHNLLQPPQDSAFLIDQFYSHPLITTLAKRGEHPAYVDPKTFALTLMDILGKAAAATATVEERFAAIRKFVAAELPDGSAKTTISLLIAQSDDSLSGFQQQLEGWFDSSMDRVSGWYKSKIQIITALVAVVVTIFMNADTIEIARKLLVFPVLRDQIVQAAGKARDGGQTPDSLTASQKANLAAVSGWSEEFLVFHRLKACREAGVNCNGISDREAAANPKLKDAWDNTAFPGADLVAAMTSGLFFLWVWQVVPGHLAGWAVSAAAASLGAPFWFDTLNRFMNIRAAGTSPNEKGSRLSKV